MRCTSAESNAKTTRPLEDRPGTHTRRARHRHSTTFSDRPPGPAGAPDLQQPHCPQPQVAQSLVPLGLVRNAAPSALGRPARGAAGGGLPARHGFAAQRTRFRRKYHVPPGFTKAARWGSGPEQDGRIVFPSSVSRGQALLRLSDGQARFSPVQTFSASSVPRPTSTLKPRHPGLYCR